MKWALIGRAHINLNNVDAFKWEDGMLHVFFHGDPKPESWEDPDRKLYTKLCQSQGVCVYLEPTTVTHEERCVCCGRVIPEGRQVCPICEGKTV